MVTKKTFKEYLKTQERIYNYRIKTVVPMDEQGMERIEHVMQKYVLQDIIGPEKTILQKHPLDFQDVQNVEVWIIDVVTSLPASSYVLKQELKLALNIPEKYIVVRSENDPLEVETQRMNANDEIDMLAMEKGVSPVSRLSTNSAYDEDERGDLEEPVYGNDYNSKFLETLAKVAADREQYVALADSDELDQGGTVADDVQPEDGNAFNDDMDVPEVKSSNYLDTLTNLRKTEETKKSRLSVKGNYDDDEIKQSKKFAEYGVDKKVATVVIKNERTGIRK